MNYEECGNCANCNPVESVCESENSKRFQRVVDKNGLCKYFFLREKFTWDKNSCDPKIYNGYTVLVCDMKKEDASRLMKDLSYCSGIKYDFHYAAGRTIIKVEEVDWSRGSTFIRENLRGIEKEYKIEAFL